MNNAGRSRMMPRHGAAALMLALTASCAGYPGPGSAGQSDPLFDPVVFFSGQTRGEGRLKIMFRRAVPITVRGSGSIEADGTLRLRQDIERQGRVTGREWQIRRLPDGRYAATLSEAVGPVMVDVRSSVLRIGYRTRSGERIRQSIRLQPGSNRAQNRMNIIKFGMVVATISEEISRIE